MKNIKVSVLNEHTLRLEEDGKKGDLIDLKSIIDVDTKPILEAIKNAQDKVYENEIQKAKKAFEMEKDLAISKVESELKLEINSLKEQLESNKKIVEQQVENKYINKIKELENKIEQAKHEKDLEYTNKINRKEFELNSLKQTLESEIRSIKQQMTSALENKDLLKENEIQKVKNVYEEQIRELENDIARLQRERSSLNVKTIGENLELWCDNEFQNQVLAGLSNVTWEKDNEVVKGHKADFIYKVYASEEKKENELLTSVILEMKSEDPLSENKQVMDRLLKKLDQDRKNKNIEYALMVSEIGSDANLNIPIRKVLEYEKMYIVRPEYFLTLLNIITSFGMKYKELLLAKEEERIKFKDFEDILEEFEEMKDGILNHSIKHINTHMEEILKQTTNITNANKEIIKSAEIILNTHLKTVENKIKDFRITRITNKINNL